MVDCERGAGDLRELLRQVYWKDGTLLAEHDWLHDDPTYANFFLRSAAERGEWLPAKLLGEAKPTVAPVSADVAAQGQAPVFAGGDVQQDRVSIRNSQSPQSATKLEMTLTEHGWHVVASHPWGGSFLSLCDDAKFLQHIGDWLSELRAEAALGRNETLEETQDRLDGAAAAAQGASRLGNLPQPPEGFRWVRLLANREPRLVRVSSPEAPGAPWQPDESPPFRSVQPIDPAVLAAQG